VCGVISARQFDRPGETTRPKTDLGFDASKAPLPDPTKGRPVARALNRYLYAASFGGKLPRGDTDARYKLQGMVFGPRSNAL
jgi:hypothetical protein